MSSSSMPVPPEVGSISSSNVEAASETGSRILVICRSPELRLYIQKGLARGNHDLLCVATLTEARGLLAGGAPFRAMVLEVEDSLRQESMEELKTFCGDFESVPLLAIAPNPSAELVRDVLLAGVKNFVTDPFDKKGIEAAIEKVVHGASAAGDPNLPASRQAEEEKEEQAGGGKKNGADPRRRCSPSAPGSIITSNPRMLRILEIIERVGPTDSTVLIQGESGTGKELVAKRIHVMSKRASRPFVEVNCGAIPPNLLESQLFGHEKGSFTGAVHRQVGLFEIADRGTIFLDEIAEMNLDMQVKLLRVLQERSFRRVGGNQNIHVDVRVVAATNRDLKAEVERKQFRADLFYRLNVIALELPPLRDRLEDIPDLVEHFCERLQREKGLARKRFTPEVLREFQQKRWVGNVREIENVVERLVLLSPGDEIVAADLGEHHSESGPPLDSPFAPTLTLDEVKRIHITSVLKANNGNKMKTARLLGINVKTLYNLIQRLQIPA